MRVSLLFSLLIAWVSPAAVANEFHELSVSRITEIEAMLPAEPGGF